MQSLWQGGNPSTLVLAGADIEDFNRFHESLPQKVKSKCLMLEFVDDETKLDLLDACNMLVLPSRSDSFGIVFLEAWFYGKPVVGARAGGIPGLVREGVDGLLFPFGDEKELALSIQKLLLDRTEADRLGEEGRNRVLSEFTWDRKYQVVKELYGELTGSPAAV
jgi:glycosyltransferase involved in cell wall biosynthesis